LWTKQTINYGKHHKNKASEKKKENIISSSYYIIQNNFKRKTTREITLVTAKENYFFKPYYSLESYIAGTVVHSHNPSYPAGEEDQSLMPAQAKLTQDSI
jgi:hypothetical protein